MVEHSNCAPRNTDVHAYTIPFICRLWVLRISPRAKFRLQWRTISWPLLLTTSSSCKNALILHSTKPQSIQRDVLFLGLIHLPAPPHAEYLAMHAWGTRRGERDEGFPGLPPPQEVTVQRKRPGNPFPPPLFFFLLWERCNLRDAKLTLEAFFANWLGRQICVVSDAFWELFSPPPSFHLI